MSLTINADTLPRYQTRAILGVVTLLMLVVSAFFIITTYQAGYDRIEEQAEQLKDERRQRLRSEIDAALNYIDYTRQQTEAVLRDNIREQVRHAMELARAIHTVETARQNNPEAIATLIRESLRNLRFFDGRGYLFIDTMDGECVLLPTQPEIEGYSLLDNRDDSGRYIMQGLIEAARKPAGSGYVTYRWYAPGSTTQMHDKIAYVEHFEPLDWVIGTGDYLYEVENDLKREMLRRLQAQQIVGEGYMSVLDATGRVLLSPSRPNSEGLAFDELADEHRALVNMLVDQATPNGRFVEYRWYEQSSDVMRDKLALVQLVPEWGWVLVASVYQDALADVIEHQKRRLEAELHADLQALFLLLISALVVAMAVALLISRWLRQLMQRYRCELEQQQAELAASNHELQLAGQIFEAAGEGAMITDANNCIMAVNPAFTRITGYSADEVIGQKPSLLASGLQSRTFYARMWQALSEEKRWQGEVWNRRRTGEFYPQWLSITVIEDEQGLPCNYVAMFNDITERKATEDQLRYLSDYDALTDLPNRRLLRERVTKAVQDARATDQPLGLLIIDLDRFKGVNDSLGHAAGDTLLKAVAHRLARSVRSCDTLSRIGGDEFAVLLTEVNDTDALQGQIEHYLALVAVPLNLDGHELVVTACAGLALYPQDGEDFDTLLRNSDTALYHAKERGRNNLELFAPVMTRQVSDRLLLEGRLREALKRGEFELYYQPQYDFAHNRLTDCEALIRWNSPEGMVMPDTFIPLAEETGLIVPIGAWVLQEACRQGEAWNRVSVEPLSVAVNVSAVQFRPALVSEVQAALDETGFDACLLVLEVTESVLMSDIEGSVQLLQELRELGVRVALDDFGTGYASLAYLKRFVLDKLKIDRAFIMGIPDDKDDVAITSSIIDIARNLNIMTVAEGVETEAHCAFLRKAGCNLAQGYYFDKPLPAEEFMRRLQ
ncbi:bifunctional diguanylate cyclase/phosphodiesterase [Marinobacterium weihaiense]|uniref:Cache domain-containing protein n=1 Tax=Marinobacterium weihaiense TaxID=2851016 RepID=A0ABS6MBQ3_9GAMM|nr:cache domain-containing protein [Marinobacterium weihaiense]MBV0933600.1 cache domain-containing protein [Marinobacterium weihaiense]